MKYLAILLLVLVAAPVSAQSYQGQYEWNQFVRCQKMQQQRNLQIQRQKSRPHTNRWVARTPSNPPAYRCVPPTSRKKKPVTRRIGSAL